MVRHRQQALVRHEGRQVRRAGGQHGCKGTKRGNVTCEWGPKPPLAPLPEAMVGPTPLRLHRACAEAWRSPVFCNFLKAFFVSVITTLGVFICIRFNKLA